MEIITTTTLTRITRTLRVKTGPGTTISRVIFEAVLDPNTRKWRRIK